MVEVKILEPGHCTAKGTKGKKVQIADTQIMDIINMWENGSSADEIGALYKISSRHVRRLLKDAGYEKEGRRSKYHNEIEATLEILKQSPLMHLHKVVPDDKNLRRAVKARWDAIKEFHIEGFLQKAKDEIQKIKELILKNPNLTLKDLGYDAEEIKLIEKQLGLKEKEFESISEVRKAAICDEWTGLYLLRGRNVLKLIKNGKIETNSGHLKKLDDNSDIDVSNIKINIDEGLETGRKRNKKGGNTNYCRIIELMK